MLLAESCCEAFNALQQLIVPLLPQRSIPFLSVVWLWSEIQLYWLAYTELSFGFIVIWSRST
jgi:hypothetical protein